MIFLQLYWEFFKIGLFAAGGGMATVPFLFDLSARTGWFTAADLANMIAVSEATPGPIGINMATYVGYVSAGPAGGLIASLGLITPAVVIILLISCLLGAVWKGKRVQAVFRALRPASVGLILAAAWTVCEVSLFSLEGGFTLYPAAVALFAAILLLMNLPRTKSVPPVLYVAAAAAAGVILGM